MLQAYPHANMSFEHFANLAPQISKAAEDYAAEVTARTFPDVEHTYQMKRQKL